MIYFKRESVLEDQDELIVSILEYLTWLCDILNERYEPLLLTELNYTFLCGSFHKDIQDRIIGFSLENQVTQKLEEYIMEVIVEGTYLVEISKN